LQSLKEVDSDVEESAERNIEQKVNAIVTPATNFETALVEMMKVLHMIVEKLDKPKETYRKPWRPAEQQKRGVIVCWGCGEVGHLRTKCMRPTGNATPAQGNASRPQA
jgi:hypothetical protein